MSARSASATVCPRGTPTVLRLGWVSFFNDASSQILVRVLPLHLAFNLGLSLPVIGMIEGLSESLAVGVKALSGWLSDRVDSRKDFVAGGYALSTASRLLFLAIGSPLLLGLGRILDRLGKGLRCPARDALVADSAAPGESGRAFGWACMLDSLGAVTGLGVVLFLGIGNGSLSPDVFRTCVLVAAPLGLVASALVLFWVPRTNRTTAAKRLAWKPPASIHGLLPIVFLFGLASSSDAFIVLRARELGFTLRDTFGLLALHHLLAAVLAQRAARVSDQLGRLPFLMLGWGLYAACYMVMGSVNHLWVFGATLIVYGAYYGLTEGVLRALLADLLPEKERGSGYGSLQVALGVAALLSSPLMGFGMAVLGPRAAFLCTGLIALGAAGALGLWSRFRSQLANTEPLSSLSITLSAVTETPATSSDG